MSKFIVVVFSGETQAYKGSHALKELDAEGSLTLYGMALVAKDVKGNISTKETADAGPLGTAVGTLVGGLIGVIGGPVGSLAGAAGGALIGSIGDLFDYGVGEDFVEKVAAELAPGKAAIIAEIGEDWTTPLDTRMETFGGTVLRTWRADFEDDQIENEIAAERAELDELKAEHAQAKQEAKAKLAAKIEQTKANLKGRRTAPEPSLTRSTWRHRPRLRPSRSSLPARETMRGRGSTAALRLYALTTRSARQS